MSFQPRVLSPPNLNDGMAYDTEGATSLEIGAERRARELKEKKEKRKEKGSENPPFIYEGVASSKEEEGDFTSVKVEVVFGDTFGIKEERPGRKFASAAAQTER